VKFKIEGMQTVKGSNRLYVDVAFLEGGEVVHRNDFIMQIAPTHRRYVGDLGPDGEILDPKAYEEYETDVAATIVANIQRYAARAAMKRADNRDLGIITEDTDPLGLRAKPGVADLIGTEVAA
jgi:hypothetical protein